MRLLDIWRSSRRKTGAEQAKERLQIVLAHERAGRSGPDYLPLLQKDLLAVISKYVEIDESKVAVKLERCIDYSTLEVNIELPARLADKLQTGVGELAHGTG